jgi:LysR family transcriptional regulator for bpeEF and oprC
MILKVAEPQGLGERQGLKGETMSLTATLRDLNKLNTFVRVAERQSFTKAALDLRTTPSVVSKHMTDLENALGFSLLNRSTHGVVLTDAGGGLFQNFTELLSKLDDYVVDARNLQAGPVGTLRVQATGDYARCVLAPLIVDFVGSNPAMRVHLSVLADNCISSDDGFDVILASNKPAIPGLIDQELGQIPYVICASPEYFRRAGRPMEPQGLREHNCLTNMFSGSKDWPFQTASRPQIIQVKGSLSSDSYSVLTQMALQACGIIRVPLHAVKAELANKSLESIFDDISSSPERVNAYFSKAKHLPAKTSRFIAFLSDFIGAKQLPCSQAEEMARASTCDEHCSRAAENHGSDGA